jgi:hypothetical protein
MMNKGSMLTDHGQRTGHGGGLIRRVGQREGQVETVRTSGLLHLEVSGTMRQFGLTRCRNLTAA